MVKIVILEGVDEAARNMRKEMIEWSKSKWLPLDIITFNDTEKFLKYLLIENDKVNAIFIGMDLRGNDSVIEVAMKVREMNESVPLIYSGYHINVNDLRMISRLRMFAFVYKGKLKEDIYDEMDRIVKLCDKKEFCFRYKCDHEIRRIRFEDIVYFKSNRRKVKIFYYKKEGDEEAKLVSDEFYGKLSVIEKKLGANFMRTHQSYIVNTYCAQLGKDRELELIGEKDEVLVSKHYRGIVLETLDIL